MPTSRPIPSRPVPIDPVLTSLSPPAAMPGSEIELCGHDLLGVDEPRLSAATIGVTPARVTLLRPTRATLRIPDDASSGPVVLTRHQRASNQLPVRIATAMADNLHPVANPAVDAAGDVYATFSGTRGQQVPVSIFRISPSFESRPFVRDLLNPTGLAFDREGFLYASSRAEGIVYRISPEGAITTYAEGLGIATGIAFDADDNLFVGDRTGTIFKISRSPRLHLARHTTDPLLPAADETTQSTFVFATLEPSIAAYHLAFNAAGTLFVTGPTTSSNQSIHTIDRDGNASVFFRGLGRAQGMAFDQDDNLYVAASLHGQRGIVRITPADPTCATAPQASLAIAGNNLVGLCFLPNGAAALATRDGLFHIDLGIPGRPLA